MSTQLLLYVNPSNDGQGIADILRWCWLGADGRPDASTAASGDGDSLQAALPSGEQQSAWLMLPGHCVNTRELEYSDKEKKHLRNLLPYQLEDNVVGDVDDLHFALGTPAQGRVVVSYINKAWLQETFAHLKTLGVDVTRCFAAPMMMPLHAPSDATTHQAWTAGLFDGQCYLRHGTTLGFGVSEQQAAFAFQLMLAELNAEQLVELHLRAESTDALDRLTALLPEQWQSAVASTTVASFWDVDTTHTAIDLCQGEFSQRLPFERWWKTWRSIALFAGACTALYLGALFFEIFTLNRDTVSLRQQIEASTRNVITQGRITDPERQLNTLLKQLQPAASSSGRVMELLAIILPEVGKVPSVSIKAIAYSADASELNLSVQADSYATFETLAGNIRGHGLNAEVQSANAQGNVQTARLRITRN
jgi:general secretion pathway protein L